MPIMETVTIINKSGKVVSTGKHLVNIFKGAKDAYNEKKAGLRTEHRQKLEYKQAQKLLAARAVENTQSVASSRHSHRSHRSHRDRDGVSRPPLTERNLTNIPEGSVTSSRRSRSHHGSRAGSRHGGGGSGHRSRALEEQPSLQRRHTDQPSHSQDLTQTPPSPYTTQIARSQSNPDFHGENEDIDMNLAYGALPAELQIVPAPAQAEAELAATMTRLDALLLEAQCVQHSATAIIKNLQDNPEAMAAVALTLAELSNILTKMSPAILTALKGSSPAVFALLASPQFLIAGGLALGVTVVMFGGYKIVKKIQANNEAKKEEANRMEEALVWDAGEMGSIESWRRGISAADGAGGEDASIAGTSVEGEFITPEAARQKKERIKERRRMERDGERSSGWRGERAESVAGSERTLRPVASDSTLRRKVVPIRSSSSKVAPSESGRSERSRKESKGKEVVLKEKKKKTSALSVIFSKKSKDKGKDKESSVGGKSHRPRMIEL